MRWAFGAAIFIAILVSLNINKTRDPIVHTLATANVAAGQVIAAPVIDAVSEMNKKAMDRVDEARKREYDAQKIKVYIAARDTKTCMRILHTDVINGSVIECNKDRTVEVRRDEIEQFKRDQQIN